MPEREDPQREEGARELMNMSQLATALGVTRQWLHALRVKDPDFPPSERPPGRHPVKFRRPAHTVGHTGRGHAGDHHIRPMTDAEREQGQIDRGEVRVGPAAAREIAARVESGGGFWGPRRT